MKKDVKNQVYIAMCDYEFRIFLSTLTNVIILSGGDKVKEFYFIILELNIN